MAPNQTSSWTPSVGRHQLNIGPSLNRALKAQKTPGQQLPAKRNLPEREFYSVRYRFKPSLIDSTKPGSLEVRRGSDASTKSVTVEHASSQPGEIYSFPGNEVASKEWTCVLIYDEETGGYTLEKLESSIALGPPEKRAGTTRPSRSPADSPAGTAATSSTQAAGTDSAFEEILPESLLASSTPMIVDDDEEDIPLQTQVQPPPPPPPAQQRPRKPLPQRSRTEQQRPSTAKASTVSAAVKPKKAAKRATPTFSDAEDETVVEPERPTKRNRAPPPISEPKRGPSPSRLELPGTSNVFVQPPPLPSSMTKPIPSSSRAQPQLPEVPLEPLSPLPPSAGSDSEDDEWDEIAAPVSTAPAAVPVPAPAPAEDEGGVEIDVDEFENLMNAQMDEAEDDEPEALDDFLTLAIAPEEQTPVLPPRGPPISLYQLAKGGDSGDEDDYSSSDESDDE